MKTFFAILALLLAPLVSSAQEKPVTTPQLSPGQYRGEVEWKGHYVDNAFRLTINQDRGKLSGDSQFWKGPSACRTLADLTGTVKKNGTVELKTTNALKGCERTFTLRVVTDTELDGELVGPDGNFKVKLAKK
jgi:hypothetical protein